MVRGNTRLTLQVYMFTGLIESLGTVRSVQHLGTSATLVVDLGALTETGHQPIVGRANDLLLQDALDL